MPLTPQLIEEAVARYAREIDRYEKLAAFVGGACRDLLEQHSVRGSVEHRAKEPARLKAKLQKYLDSGEHAASFTDVDSVFRVLKDFAGARITTYVEADRSRAVALVNDRFDGLGHGSPVTADRKDQPLDFYRATHCMVRLKPTEAVGRYANLAGLGCEVQVCSQLAHVYHEIEHDLRYKPLSGSLSRKEHDLLNALARLMEVSDTIINQTRDAVETRQRENRQRLSSASLSTRPDAQFRNNPFLSVVADSPFLLDLAGHIQANRQPDDLPDTPATLYGAMLRHLIDSRARGRDSAIASVENSEAFLADLGRITWTLFLSDSTSSSYDRRALLATVTRVTNGGDSASAALVATALQVGILVSSANHGGAERLVFAHRSFRVYLVARHLASKINRDGWDRAVVELVPHDSGRTAVRVAELLDSNAFDPEWQEVYAFVCGLMNEPRFLLGLLADRNRDDHERNRLGLFCRCYRAVNSTNQRRMSADIAPAFEEVVRIARRCENDAAGHRKPWLEWVELLLPSVVGAEALCAALLTLEGRYHGHAVSAKVLELFERVLTRATVSPTVVGLIARAAERDEQQWGTNTAWLALRLSEESEKEELVRHFSAVLNAIATSLEVKVRMAEAIASADAPGVSPRAAAFLIDLAQDAAVEFDVRNKALRALVPILDTSLASTVAPVLVDHLLNPASQDSFWLGWRLIDRAERHADSAWSATFLSIALFADREDDQRLRLWSAQVLSQHSVPHLRAIGAAALLALVHEKKTHSWAHAARWLVERAPTELADAGRAALLAEAGNADSRERLVATAELLEMRAISPDGGPIRDALRRAVLKELDEHGREYGSRLHVQAPGVPERNIDAELFVDNPTMVIKTLHTFGGPSFYVRDMGDPNEEHRRMRYYRARMLWGTRYWDEVLRSSLETVNHDPDPDRSEAWSIVLFASTGSVLLDLLNKCMTLGRSAKRARQLLMEELYERGWRLRFRMRNVDVLWKGREEPRTADL